MSRHYIDVNFCGTDCFEYEIVYSDCCRNSSITSGAADEGISIVHSLFGPNDSICNHSPVFSDVPLFFICQNSVTELNIGGMDMDGDSLSYSLVSCDNPIGTVTYNLGYSPQVPLGSQWIVDLDSVSGLLTFLPNPGGGSLEVGVICVQVEEYREGILVGSTVRDFQVKVVSCNNPPLFGPFHLLSGSGAVASDTIQACPGSSITFEIEVSDSDLTDSLLVDSNVDQMLFGASVSISGVNPAMIQVSWTPDSLQLGQTLEFHVCAGDVTCPYERVVHKSYFVEVSSPCLGAVLSDIACLDSTGAIDLTVVGGVMPYSYVWNTGDTTEDLQGLTVGSYWVEVSDSSGQVMFLDTFHIDATDIMLTSTISPPNCNGNGGQIDLQVSGGAMPYTYQWSTGGQMSSINGIAPGGYFVMVTDANGCPQHEVFFLDPPDTCYVSVSGKAFYDLNNNCIQDANEFGIPYLYIENTPGAATFTDMNGAYSILLDTGLYVLEAIPASGTNLAPSCPANGQHTLSFGAYSEDTTGVNFGMDLLPVPDLRAVSTFGGWPNPGFPFIYYLHLYNDGNIPVDAIWELELDPQLNYDSSSISPLLYNQNSNTLVWNLNPMLPGQHMLIRIYGTVATSAMIGDTLLTELSIFPTSGDVSPANNVCKDTLLVVASFDPNNKSVSPKGYDSEGFISERDKDMSYTIRFQNTGNFPAQYVAIRDTVHYILDLKSFRPRTHSHPYSLSVEEDSILVFFFDGIGLPDSVSDPINSQGHVSFVLSHNGTLSPRDQLLNSGAIYFDFAPPIHTNEVVNTIEGSVSGIEDNFTQSLTIFPNPFSDQTMIRFANPRQQPFELIVLDMRGKMVKTYKGIQAGEIEVSRGNLSRGMYLFQLRGDRKQYIGKLLIE